MINYSIEIPKFRMRTAYEDFYITENGDILSQSEYTNQPFEEVSLLSKMSALINDLYSEEGSLNNIQKLTGELEQLCLQTNELKRKSELCRSAKKVTLKNTQGVYIFFSKAGTVLYVGQSTNLLTRLQVHIGGNSNVVGLSQTYDTFTYIALESQQEINFVEWYLIQELKPRLNKAMVNYTKKEASDCGDGEQIDSIVEAVMKEKNAVIDKYNDVMEKQHEERMKEFKL